MGQVEAEEKSCGGGDGDAEGCEEEEGSGWHFWEAFWDTAAWLLVVRCNVKNG